LLFGRLAAAAALSIDHNRWLLATRPSIVCRRRRRLYRIRCQDSREADRPVNHAVGRSVSAAIQSIATVDRTSQSPTLAEMLQGFLLVLIMRLLRPSDSEVRPSVRPPASARLVCPSGRSRSGGRRIHR